MAASVTTAWAQEPPSSQPSGAAPSGSAAAPTQSENTLVSPSIKLRGSVWRMRPGIVFVKTPIGLMTLSSKTGLRDLRGSHEIYFFANGPDVGVDIRRRADGSLAHRYLMGPLRFASPEKKEIKLWTPEGEKSLALAGLTEQIGTMPEQAPVTVEVDEAGSVLSTQDLQYDLQVSAVPHESTDTYIYLKGTVTKLKSNFIFCRTPLGIVPVSSKTGVRNAKVGQEMTLWADGGNVAVDLASPGAATPSRRFITSRLAFADGGKTAVSIWTPEGRRTFSADHAKAALSRTREGALITLELNENGSIVEIRTPN